MGIDLDLLKKYDVATPRYTSYPTVPFWQEQIDRAGWISLFGQQFALKNCQEGISLYIHLPFCEALCTYCGCNKKITTNHGVEGRYLQAIIKEWRLYRAIMGERPVIREIHLGGGTPTFFSPENLVYLITSILNEASVHPQHEFGLEGHPNNTTKTHLRVLHELGFRRVSYGVQDHDPRVQHIINRIQPYENVRRATVQAREVGYESVNFDLIYGLPLQTVDSMIRTIEQSIGLQPDRVAFYSYAHVPWKSKGQRLFDEKDLPSADLKKQLYQTGKQLFTDCGYYNIGMDHFALPTDSLSKAWKTGQLHRNFMGYTSQHASMLLGLGVSSISDAGLGFAQNSKTIHDYYNHIEHEELAISKGYFLNAEDVAFRQYIMDIACQGRTQLQKEHLAVLEQLSYPVFEKLVADRLIDFDVTNLSVRVTALGRNFLRNICKAFDLHLLRAESSLGPSQSGPDAFKMQFSKAI